MSKALAVLLELKESASYWGEYDVPIGIHERIDEAIAELFTQPEQTEQEPVAWKDRTYGNLHHVDWGDSMPLYASPPKREALSSKEIANFLDSKDEDDFEISHEYEQEPDYEDGPEFKGWDKRSGTQEPVAWITEWEQKQVSTSIFKDQTLRRVSFTKSNAPSAVLNHIPLYTAPKKREPLSNTEVEQTTKNMSEFGADMFKAGIAAAERAHGIGVDDEYTS